MSMHVNKARVVSRFYGCDSTSEREGIEPWFDKSQSLEGKNEVTLPKPLCLQTAGGGRHQLFCQHSKLDEDAHTHKHTHTDGCRVGVSVGVFSFWVLAFQRDISTLVMTDMGEPPAELRESKPNSDEIVQNTVKFRRESADATLSTEWTEIHNEACQCLLIKLR